MINYLKKAYQDHKQDLPNMLWQLAYGTGKQFFVVGIFALCAFMLNPYDFGFFNYATAILLLLVLFGDFGISVAASKYVAEYKALNEEREQAVLFNSMVFALGFVLISGTFVLLFAPHFFQGNAKYIYVLLPSLLFLPIAYLYAGIYRGIGRFKAAACITLITGTISFVAAYFLIKYMGLYGALWSQNVFSFLLCFSLALGYKGWKPKFDFGLIKKIGSYSFVLGVASLSYYVYSRTDIILLGRFGHIPEIGFYELVNKSFMFLASPFMIAAQTISPQIGGLNIKGEYKVVFHKYKQLISLSFVSSLFLTLVVYFSAPYILKISFPQYSDAMFLKSLNIMLIMLVSQAVAAIASVGFSIATGHAKLNMYYLIVFGLINIPLTYILIGKFGYIGAAYATVIIRCLTDVLFVATYYFIIKKHAQA